jgi:putative endonuclease
VSAWVYILKCSDNSYYTGSTVDLQGRLIKHSQGAISSYTAKKLPVKLVFSQEFYTVDEAIRAERQIKGWSRAKKEALINSDFDLLVELSKNSNAKEERE